jgi:hypothetical protein
VWEVKNIEFIKKTNQKNLWMHVFDILANHLHLYYELDKFRHVPNVKAKVMENLRILWSYGEEFCSINSLYTFLLTKKTISRSAAHKVVRELELDGRGH